jgi:hypothetical protein
MSKRSLPVLLVFIAVLSVCAGEPWLNKPYQSWDKKDVHKILSDSPWAETVQVDAFWRRNNPESMRSTGAAGGLRAPTTPNNPSGPLSSDASQSSPGQPSAAMLGREAYAPVVVRWASSVTSRAAAAQQKMLQGGISPGQVDAAVALEPGQYEIVLVFDPIVGLPPASDTEMGDAAFLTLKPSGARLQASHVQIRDFPRSVGGEVGFYFSKNRENGEPLISPDQTEAQFQLQAGKVVVRATFQLRKMRTKNGPDY